MFTWETSRRWHVSALEITQAQLWCANALRRRSLACMPPYAGQPRPIDAEDDHSDRIRASDRWHDSALATADPVPSCANRGRFPR
jgi:hypothetical protein